MDVRGTRIGWWDPPVARDDDVLNRCDGASPDRYRMDGFWYIGLTRWRGCLMHVRRGADGNRTDTRWDGEWRRSLKRTYRRRRFGTRSVISVGGEKSATRSVTYDCCRWEALECKWMWDRGSLRSSSVKSSRSS